MQFCRLKKKMWMDQNFLLNGLKQKPMEVLGSFSAARTSRPDPPGPAWTRLDPPGPASPSSLRLFLESWLSPRELVCCDHITLYFSIWTNWSGSVSWTMPVRTHRASSGRPLLHIHVFIPQLLSLSSIRIHQNSSWWIQETLGRWNRVQNSAFVDLKLRYRENLGIFVFSWILIFFL